MTVTAPQTGPVLRAVVHDLYRDIHKGIRSELFALVEEAGRADAAVAEDRAALAVHLRSVTQLLTSHANHEDRAIQPVLEDQLPALAGRIADDHLALDTRLADLAGRAEAAVALVDPLRRHELHTLYVELAAFTSVYLVHQDFEERVVMPSLEDAIGPDEVIRIHHSILAAIPPDEMARSLALMLPALNIDERATILGGMRAGAPAEVFERVWGLARSVLAPPDLVALGARLDIA